MKTKQHRCRFNVSAQQECGAPAAWVNHCAGLPDTHFCEAHKQELETDAGFPGQWEQLTEETRRRGGHLKL